MIQTITHITELIYQNWAYFLLMSIGIISLNSIVLYIFNNKLFKVVSFDTSTNNANYDNRIKDLLASIKDNKNPGIEEAVDKKKLKFLNIPTITLHYANEEDINNIYNDYFNEPTIEKIISESAKELGGGVKGEASKVFGASIEGKDIRKLIQTMKIPDISIAEKFRRYQRETIENNQVYIGLDLVDIDLTELNAFNRLVAELESKINMKLEDLKIENHRAILKEKAVDRTIIRLEDATGWILLDGKFKISPYLDDFYKCIYEHPVNEYINEKDNKITISMILNKQFLKSSVSSNYAQSGEMLIPLKVYGNVWQPLNREEDVWDLQITPLAIY